MLCANQQHRSINSCFNYLFQSTLKGSLTAQVNHTRIQPAISVLIWFDLFCSLNVRRIKLTKAIVHVPMLCSTSCTCNVPFSASNAHFSVSFFRLWFMVLTITQANTCFVHTIPVNCDIGARSQPQADAWQPANNKNMHVARILASQLLRGKFSETNHTRPHFPGIQLQSICE